MESRNYKDYKKEFDSIRKKDYRKDFDNARQWDVPTGNRKIKKITYIALLICIVGVIGLFCYQGEIGPFAESTLFHPKVNDNRTKQEAQSDFDKLMNEIFKEEVTNDTLTLNYKIKDKNAYGIEEGEPTLGEYSLAELKNSLLVSENRVATLETYDYKKLTKEQQLIYDAVYLISKQNLESADFLEYTECLSPTSGVQAQLPVLFAEYHFYDKKDVENYISLLGQVPEYFKQVIAFEQEKSEEGIFMSDTTAQAIITQCSDFIENPDKNYLITVFDKKINAMSGLTDAEKKAFIQKNKEAVKNSIITAYQSLIDGLTELKGSGKNKNGLCHLKKGEEYYAYLIKSKTGSSRSLKDINTLLDDKISVLKKEMANIMADSPDVYYDAQDVSYPYSEPAKAMEHLKEAIQKDFPKLDDSIKCQIKYVDESMEESMSPAFYLMPAVDEYKNNVVYINQNEKYDLTKAFTTIGHESYPGHLYQTCYFQSQNPSPIRSVISVGGYTEGWGTYAELYSYDLADIDKDVANLLKKNTLLTLCIYAKADIGVNYLGWDYEKLQSYLTDFGFSKSNSRIIFDSMVAEPADYMQYTLGYLEIEELLERAKDKLGDKFVLKEFHEFFLSVGPVPFDVVKNQMENWLEEQKEK